MDGLKDAGVIVLDADGEGTGSGRGSHAACKANIRFMFQASDQVPLTFDLVEAAQVELSEAHHRFDDVEHRFRGVPTD